MIEEEMTSELALLGGSPAVSKLDLPTWPEITEQDKSNVMLALTSGDFTASRPNGFIEQLETEWANFVRAKHCVGVSNGTAAISMALAALGVGPGDEVIVPALSFVATAVAVVHIGAIPVFADIDPISFNIDTQRLSEYVTDRTKAIVVVHLHGLPADMDEIMSIARARRLVVVEDAAQAHGAVYRGAKVGTIGDAGTFSLSVSKNLPTCGEGGLVTTNRSEVADRVRMLRQFGEDVVSGQVRKYEHRDLGWNNKMGAVQAAFTLSQLGRFPAHNDRRQAQVCDFLHRIGQISGVSCPTHDDDRSHVWHILRFRLDPTLAGIDDVDPGSFRIAVQRALNAEGCPVREYQTMPLSAQPIFASSLRGSWAEGLLGKHEFDFREDAFPNTCAVVTDSFVLQKIQQVPGSERVLENCAVAFEKVFRNLDFIAELAKSRPFSPPWRH